MLSERLKACVECVAWLVFAGAIYFFSLGFRTDGLGGGYQLGPEFWVDLVIGLMVISAFANLGVRMIALRDVQAGLQKEMQSANATPRATMGKIVQIAAMFVIPLLFVWLITRIGFYLSLPLFVIGVLLALGERRLLPIAGMTTVVSAALFLFFTTLLYVPLPLGNIEMFYEINVAIRVFLR